MYLMHLCTEAFVQQSKIVKVREISLHFAVPTVCLNYVGSGKKYLIRKNFKFKKSENKKSCKMKVIISKLNSSQPTATATQAQSQLYLNSTSTQPQLNLNLK